MVVGEAEARAAYEEALRKTGVAYDIAGCFNEVLRLSISRAYSGILIDILTLIRSSKEEKSIAYDCINYYPAVRVKWDARSRSMNLSPLDQASTGGGETTLSCFIEKRCKPFTARSLRKFKRKDVNLSLLLSRRAECVEGECLKSFTVNLSEGGAFVHTNESFARGEAVWLHFLDLSGSAPVRAEVCWRIEWGASRSIPGIGVMFTSLQEEQLEQIRKIAGL